MALVWVVVADIWVGQFRSFTAGQIVPDSVEALWDYSGQGIVVRQEVAGGGTPDIEQTGVATPPAFKKLRRRTSSSPGSCLPVRRHRARGQIPA